MKRCTETHFIHLLDVNFRKSKWSVKYKLRAPGHGVGLNSLPMTIAMQGFILAATTVAEIAHFNSILNMNR